MNGGQFHCVTQDDVPFEVGAQKGWRSSPPNPLQSPYYPSPNPLQTLTLPPHPLQSPYYPSHSRPTLSKPFTNSQTPSQPSPNPLQPLTLLPNPLQAIPVLKTQYPAPCTKLHVSQSLVYREGIWISLLPPSPLIAHSNPSRLLEIPQRPPSL